MKVRMYNNLMTVLEDKCNNCIFLSRKFILRHRIRWGKLRTTQTGKTRRTMKSSKLRRTGFLKNSYLPSLWSINEFHMSSGYDWEAKKKKQLGNSDFFLLYQDHMTKYLQLPPLKTVKPKVSLSFYWIYLLFWGMLMFWKVIMPVNVLTELKVCPSLDRLESVHVKARSGQVQSSVQRARQETVKQPHA